MTRDNLLQRKIRVENSNKVYFVTKYSTNAEKIKQIIRKNWGILQSDELLRNIFSDASMISFRKCTTLGDKLVHSYLPPNRVSSWLGNKPKGCFKCHHCNHCDNVVQDENTNKVYSIRHFINCQTTHVIYRLECPQCKVFYVGRTKK